MSVAGVSSSSEAWLAGSEAWLAVSASTTMAEVLAGEASTLGTGQDRGVLGQALSSPSFPRPLPLTLLRPFISVSLRRQVIGSQLKLNTPRCVVAQVITGLPAPLPSTQAHNCPGLSTHSHCAL